MPQAENVGRLGVYMSHEAIDQITKAAKELGYKSGAEYMRDLVKRDLETRGQPIDFGLDTWGRKADTTATDTPGEAAPKRKPTKKTKTE